MKKLEPHEVSRAKTRSREGMKNIYSSIDSPIGEVFAAATEKGVCGIGLNCTETEFLHEHAGAVRNDSKLRAILKTIRRYLDGREDALESIPLDLSTGTHMQKAVWEEMRRIPRGNTVSYLQVATGIGRPKSARPVGNAVGRNPIPLLVPCHRVIRTDGSLGGFGPGLHIKEYLLELERA